MKRTFPLIPLLLTASLLLGACGAADTDAAIATSVALTLQARDATQPGIVPSATPRPDLSPVPAATASATATSAPTGAYAHCMSASLVSEAPPDKTIFHPGEYFLKTWHIQNASECNWDKDYKLVFWNGDLMSALYTYNLPQLIRAGESADISIQLKAPETAGPYKGEWKLQTPDGQNFGVGSYQVPFWVDIQVVDANATPTYGVTSVTYELDRKPQSGCTGANVFYTFRAIVTFSGPMKEVILQFQHSDGYKASKIKLEITEATTKTFTDKWSFYRTASPGPKWSRIVQIFPEYKVFDPLEFNYQCN